MRPPALNPLFAPLSTLPGIGPRLEKLFGRPVDLVPKEGLHRVIRDQVLADAQVLYAA